MVDYNVTYNDGFTEKCRKTICYSNHYQLIRSGGKYEGFFGETRAVTTVEVLVKESYGDKYNGSEDSYPNDVLISKEEGDRYLSLLGKMGFKFTLGKPSRYWTWKVTLTMADQKPIATLLMLNILRFMHEQISPGEWTNVTGSGNQVPGVFLRYAKDDDEPYVLWNKLVLAMHVDAPHGHNVLPYYRPIRLMTDNDEFERLILDAEVVADVGQSLPKSKNTPDSNYWRDNLKSLLTDPTKTYEDVVEHYENICELPAAA